MKIFVYLKYLSNLVFPISRKDERPISPIAIASTHSPFFLLDNIKQYPKTKM